MKKILVPTDFSALSEYALEFAIELAQKFNAEITLVTSLHYDFNIEIREAALVTSTLLKKVEESVNHSMQQLVNKYSDSKVLINHYISDKSLVAQLNNKIHDENYDLVVMGTKGSSGIDEFFIGSNTEKVVRKASCPVISVSGKTTLANIKKLMISLDLEDIRESFLLKIADLQKNFDLMLDFVWVKTPHNIENEVEISKEISLTLKDKGITNFSFHIVRAVIPAEGILTYVNEAKIDMIAMATHARKGIAHWLTGSVTEDTVNHAKIPVWSFKMDSKEKSINLESAKNLYERSFYTAIEMPI